MGLRSRFLWAVLITLGAAILQAQDASRDAGLVYRLRVVEPAEGLAVNGPTLRVTVELDTTRRGGTGEPGSRATPTPPPRVEIFVDGASAGVLASDQKTMTVDGLGAGAHTLLVTATGSDDVVVDRKEIHFTVLPRPPG
ncbi:MAG TPA: hypothetical protein VH854_11830 [Thermoanaerobaculia bacterium]|jgi:hypothetical protein|nr:hypothetical protein [Thermoanaerobaculia bacterium]